MKGKTGLLIAIAAVAVVFIFFPAYRLFVLVFFGISFGIGLIVAGILYLCNKYVPVKAEEVHNDKKPLGLG